MNSEWMYQRRPEPVVALCAEQFEEACSGPDGGAGRYRVLGNRPEYRWDTVSSRGLLRANGKSVLDVGCGYGDVVGEYIGRGYDNRGLGVTAYPYSVADYVVSGDVQKLNEVLKNNGDKNPFHTVMSRWLLCHLTDPLGTLEQMANAVDEGGTLVTDAIRLRTGTREIAEVCMEALVGSKHFVELSNTKIFGEDAPTIRGLHLRRRSSPSKPIQFPIGFVCDDTTWRYVVSTP